MFRYGPWIPNLSKTWRNVEFCQMLSQHEMIIKFVYIVDNVDGFLYIELFLYPWDQAYLITMHDHFDVFLDSVCKKRTSGGITIPYLKLYCRSIVLKTVWYWYRDRQVDQQNKCEDPEMNPHTYSHLIFDKVAKTIQWKKDSIFKKWCCFNWQSACRRI